MTVEKKPKVLQVIHGLGMGGAETWLMEVLRLWSRTGAGQMDFLLTGGVEEIFDREARELGAKLFYIRYGRSNLSAFVRGYRRILFREKYDAIHDHADFVSGWHFLFGTGVLPPIRVTHVHNPAYQIIHNYGVSFRRRMATKVGKLLVSRYATHIAGTSRQIITEYGFDTKAFQHIPKAALYCGFDPTRFLGDNEALAASVRNEFGWAKESKIILVAGRIDQSAEFDHPQNHKNSAFAIEIGIASARQDGRICMVLAGKQSAAVALLKQRIGGAGLSDRILFLDIRDDIARLMLGCDLLLFPSRGEGLGMVAVEAQAAGLPVLASHAVPWECVVVPNLVRFEELTSPVGVWVRTAEQLLGLQRDVCGSNTSVSRSAFSLNLSAENLITLYETGRFSPPN